jgi:long-subunit acyl-CoA synthetase (AMP-forming)
MNVALLFQALSERVPEAPVLVGDRRTLSAAALLEAIDILASRLVGRHTLAVLADNGPDWVTADLAALRTGITHVPLPNFFNASQLTHVLTQSGADTLLTDQPARILQLEAGFAVAGQWNDLTWMERIGPHPKLPRGIAKISFTSGSTGQAKGACLSASGLMETAMAVSARLADLAIERHLATLPLALLLENCAGLYAPLLRGAEIHLPGLQSLGWQGMAGFDPARLQATAQKTQASSLILVPELLKAWTLYLAATGQKAPASLAYVAVGGARVDAESIDRARSLGLPAYQGYGLTECGSVVSLNRPGDDGEDVGRPLGHVSAGVEDGEIVISTQAFLGYLGTETVRPAGPLKAKFATGDLGHVDAGGHLHLSGRRKNLLITSYGRNIAPEWVEASLLAQPAIAQAVVTGDARPWLSGVLVPAPHASREAVAAAVAHANTSLPDYARLGSWITASAFTLQNGQSTGNGRPVRAAILERYAAELAALYPQENTLEAVL